jgi:hypothetical protein
VSNAFQDRVRGIAVWAWLGAILVAGATSAAPSAQEAAPPREAGAEAGEGPADEDDGAGGPVAATADEVDAADGEVDQLGEGAERAEATEPGRGSLVEIRLPMTGNADAHAMTAIRRTVERLTSGPRAGDASRPVLILEISPAPRSGGAGEGSDFERCLSLARFLAQPEMAGVKTVAYIPRTIKGHGVLIAMACEEIAMAPQAEIGAAGSNWPRHGAPFLSRSHWVCSILAWKCWR